MSLCVQPARHCDHRWNQLLLGEVLPSPWRAGSGRMCTGLGVFGLRKLRRDDVWTMIVVGKRFRFRVLEGVLGGMSLCLGLVVCVWECEWMWMWIGAWTKGRRGGVGICC